MTDNLRFTTSLPGVEATIGNVATCSVLDTCGEVRKEIDLHDLKKPVNFPVDRGILTKHDS